MEFITLTMAAFHLDELDPRLWYCELSGTLNKNEAIVNIIVHIRALHALTSQKVCH